MEDGGSPSQGLLIFIILLIVNGVFYGFGSALQSVNEKQVKKKAEENDKKSIILSKMIDNPTHLVNTIHLIVTLINMIIGLNLVPLYSNLLGKNLINILNANDVLVYNLSFVLITIIFLVIILTFGVVAPKKIGSQKSEQFCYVLIPMIYIVSNIFKPFILLISGISNRFMKLIGIDPFAKEEDVTEEEIISMVNEGHEQGVILASEAEMITNIFEFGDTQAKDIMTHRKNMVAIDVHKTLSEVLDFILYQSKSRFPVFENDIDNIVGIIHLKNVMKCYSDESLREKQIIEIKELIREASFITETRMINTLFKNMQSQKIHMVIVIDEYGQTAGLVTMEDIIEEIVGSILDEYDEDENFIIEQQDHTFIMAGITPIEDVESILETNFEEDVDDYEYDTLNGFLISKLDRIPEENENIEIRHGGYVFKVLCIENKMIKSIHVWKEIEESENIKIDGAIEESSH